FTPSSSPAAPSPRSFPTRRSSDLRDELRNFVAEKIGAIAKPDDILFSADLPKTRSGKIMRRLLRDIAEGRALGDTTTLADPNVRSEEHTSELQSRGHLVCRLLLEK